MEIKVRTNVIKRNEQEVGFDITEIVNAIEAANCEADPIHQMNPYQVQAITDKIAAEVVKTRRAVNVEDIQEMVETDIVEVHGFEVAQEYIRYHYRGSLARNANTTDEGILSLIDQANEEVKQENSNENPVTNSTQRDYMTSEVSKDLTRRILLPEEIVKAHEEGLIYFHNSDYYTQREHSYDLINLEDVLQNGAIISETMIEEPHSFFTTCSVTTWIVTQIASSQYGDQSSALSHLVPFVDASRQKIHKAVLEEKALCGEPAGDEIMDRVIKRKLQEEVRSGIQTIQYQLVTLMTCNGQAPFVTMFMYLGEVPEGRLRSDLTSIIREVLLQRMHGVKNEKDIWTTPAFPELIYVLDEDNITEDAPHWEPTELAAECTSERLVPGYISAERMKEYKDNDVFPCMGYHSFLMSDLKGLGENDKHKYYGRFNQGVVTINLVDVACSSYGGMGRSWEILEKRLEFCHRALRCRHERLFGTVSDVVPILWQHGALARLKKGETIGKLLFDNYSTISLGYAGLYEMCMRMAGKGHTDEETGHPFTPKVMRRLSEKCEEWRATENISYLIYDTPMESTTYKFAKCLQKCFSVVPGVTDKNYITDSYRVYMSEKVDAFRRLLFEADFQKPSPGGAISYVEVPNLQNNIPAVLSIMRYIYDHIVCAEFSTKSDYCQVCGYGDEIKIRENENGKLVWECPNCDNRDQEGLFVVRRTCGCIGTQFWNQGGTQEVRNRVLHVSTTKREAGYKNVTN